jgi:hypothetical protein
MALEGFTQLSGQSRTQCDSVIISIRKAASYISYQSLVEL